MVKRDEQKRTCAQNLANLAGLAEIQGAINRKVPFGRWLKERRLWLGLTQKGVDECLGYPESNYIGKFERGVRPKLSTEVAEGLIDCLCISEDARNLFVEWALGRGATTGSAYREFFHKRDEVLSRFVGREEWLALFKLQIEGQLVDFRPLMVITGDGGLGKSSLLIKFADDAMAAGIPIALASEEKSRMEILLRWEHDLSLQGIICRQFRELMRRRQETIDKVEAEVEQALEQGQIDTALVTAIYALTERSSRLIDEMDNATREASADEVDNWLRNFMAAADIRLLRNPLDPSVRLTDIFAADLAEVSKRRVVLMLDRFEQLLSLGSWLKLLVDELANKVLLVVAGRENPEWALKPEWAERVLHCNLKKAQDREMSEVIRKYAKSKGAHLTDREITSIMRAADGVLMTAISMADIRIRFRF